VKTKIHIAIALAFIAVSPGTSLAQSQEEQNACMNDAFNVCGHAIPDRDRVAACLAQNINRISAGCRTVMQRYPKPASNTTRTRYSTRD
jgi:hypothetical protein